MTGNKAALFAKAPLVAALAAWAVCSVPPVHATGIDGGYVGSDTCLGCHDGTSAPDKTDFVKSGHPYKIRSTKGLVPVLSGGDNLTTITDPLSSILPMPPGSWINTSSLGDGCYDAITNPTSLVKCDLSGKLDWAAVQYVIGGFGWKARWGVRDTLNACPGPACKTGYVWTGADGTGGNNNGPQYNLLAADVSLDPVSLALPFGRIEDWSDYNNNSNKGYDCAQCHNTNGISYNNTQCGAAPPAPASGFGNRTRPWADANVAATDINGFKSEWTWDGVQCEACHGPGSNGTSSGHTDGGTAQNVLAITDSTATGLVTTSIVATPDSAYQAALSGNIEICAKCHMRGTNTAGGQEWGCGANKKTLRYGAEMAGGTGTNAYWLKHHEQYHEMVGYNPSATDFDPAHGDGVHRSLTCTTCHDPHIRTHTVTGEVADALGITDNDQSAAARGAIIASCESCHPGKTLKFSMPGVTCVDCHMGEATKSSPNNGDVGSWGKKGDVKTHIFKIDTTATSIVRTNVDGKFIAQNYLTVDYACGKCHDSALNSYVAHFSMTRAEAQAYAVNIHNDKSQVSLGYSLASPNTLKANLYATAYCSGPCDTYEWDCGGGTLSGTGASVSCTYATAGTYVVTLTVDASGVPGATTTRNVTVYQPDLQPTAAGVSCTVDGNWMVSFTDASTDDNAVGLVTVKWGDGSLLATGGQGSTFSRTYLGPGSYNVVHKAVDNIGQQKIETCVATVSYFTISGTVTAQDNTVIPAVTGPVASARVTVQSGSTIRTAYTSGTGAYTIGRLQPGTYSVTVTKLGYTFPAVPTSPVTVGLSSAGNDVQGTKP